MLRSFKYLLFPFSLLYGAVIFVRNKLFNINILKSVSFNFPIIGVGNIAVGGTGKTPMVEYLITLLKNDFKVATLSRGYKRKTKGFAIANETTTALEIGDEPMQFYLNFSDVTVAVGEERLVAIPQLLHQKPSTDVIILDDAFQHRQVQAGLNIVLTAYNNIYTRDLLLPAGDLRDSKYSANRANIIIVTKCKSNLSLHEKNKIINELKPLQHQSVFFTQIIYSKPYHLFSNKLIDITIDTNILLVCGIANPKPLKDFLVANCKSYDMLRYADHHIFNSDDLADIKKSFEKIVQKNKIILTTQKDAVRLVKFANDLKTYPIFVLPIQHSFLFNEAANFDKQILSFINSYKK